MIDPPYANFHFLFTTYNNPLPFCIFSSFLFEVISNIDEQVTTLPIIEAQECVNCLDVAVVTVFMCASSVSTPSSK